MSKTTKGSQMINSWFLAMPMLHIEFYLAHSLLKICSADKLLSLIVIPKVGSLSLV